MTDKSQEASKPKRLLGDLRIFQAVYNDVKLRHEMVTLENGKRTWAYVYDGLDPYELEDNHFPIILAAFNTAASEMVREARKQEILKIPKMSYDIRAIDTQYAKAWRTGANRLSAELERYKAKRLKELQSPNQEIG